MSGKSKYLHISNYLFNIDNICIAQTGWNSDFDEGKEIVQHRIVITYKDGHSIVILVGSKDEADEGLLKISKALKAF